MYSNGNLVTPDNGFYYFTLGTEYLITFSGSDINAGTQLNLFDLQEKVTFDELMTWNSNRWEYVIDGAGRDIGIQNLQVMFNQYVITTIQIQWESPLQDPPGTGGMN